MIEDMFVKIKASFECKTRITITNKNYSLEFLKNKNAKSSFLVVATLPESKVEN
jgi:hypothetical protein